MTPEAGARQTIGVLLMQAGWHVCNMSDAYIHAACGVALREFPLNIGYGFADYLLYIDGNAAGVIEAKKEGATLTGVEVQSARYLSGQPSDYESFLAIESDVLFTRYTGSRDWGVRTSTRRFIADGLLRKTQMGLGANLGFIACVCSHCSIYGR